MHYYEDNYEAQHQPEIRNYNEVTHADVEIKTSLIII